jgi:hypothetical protein
MRQFTIGILCSATFLAATACDKSPESQAPEAINAGGEVAAAADEYFTVRAGPVANAKISALAGTFQMLRVAAANGIPSNGRGGACLVFPAPDLGFTEMAKAVCHSNADCSRAPPAGATGADKGSYAPDPSNPTHREHRFGYCDVGSNVCWSRPIGPIADAALCNRPITMSPTVVNPVPADPPGPANAASLGITPGAKVRVVACINKLGANPGVTGCGSIPGPDRIEVMGPVATVKP